jgi:hypothetical protein
MASFELDRRSVAGGAVAPLVYWTSGDSSFSLEVDCQARGDA